MSNRPRTSWPFGDLHVGVDAAVLVLLALITGSGAAILVFAAHHQVAEAVLAGLAVTASSLWWYDRVIA